MRTIKTMDIFDRWFTSLNGIDRASVPAVLLVLWEEGSGLSRPYADTIRDSRYSSIKKSRVQNRGDPIRAFFAFDPARTDIVFCAGNKVGSEKRFYHEMLAVADREFTDWLNRLKEKG